MMRVGCVVGNLGSSAITGLRGGINAAYVLRVLPSAIQKRQR
jgi:hypothetical protein